MLNLETLYAGTAVLAKEKMTILNKAAPTPQTFQTLES